MWDYNNENMNEPIEIDLNDTRTTNNGQAYRRKELRLQLSFKIVFYIMIPIHIGLIISYYLTLKDTTVSL